MSLHGLATEKYIAMKKNLHTNLIVNHAKRVYEISLMRFQNIIEYKAIFVQ